MQWHNIAFAERLALILCLSADGQRQAQTLACALLCSKSGDLDLQVFVLCCQLSLSCFLRVLCRAVLSSLALSQEAAYHA